MPILQVREQMGSRHLRPYHNSLTLQISHCQVLGNSMHTINLVNKEAFWRKKLSESNLLCQGHPKKKSQTSEKRKLVPSILIGILNLRTLGLTWVWPAKINLPWLEHSHSDPAEKNKQQPLSSEGDALLSLLDTTGTAGLFNFLPHKGCHTRLVSSISTGSDFQKVLSFWPVRLLEPLLFICKPTLLWHLHSLQS